MGAVEGPESRCGRGPSGREGREERRVERARNEAVPLQQWERLCLCRVTLQVAAVRDERGRTRGEARGELEGDAWRTERREGGQGGGTAHLCCKAAVRCKWWIQG